MLDLKEVKKPSKAALHRLFGKRAFPTEITDIAQFVTNWMMAEYRFKRPSDINWGWCFIWAYFVWALSPKKVEFIRLGYGGHVVIGFDGLYYDSCNTTGIGLEKFQKEYGYEPVKKTVLETVLHWLKIGNAKKDFATFLRKTQPEKVFAKCTS
jgi:hypothetical protein